MDTENNDKKLINVSKNLSQHVTDNGYNINPNSLILPKTGEMYTNANVPLESEKQILTISLSQVAYYNELVDKDPEYFQRNNIVKIRIMKDKDHAAMLRRQYIKTGTHYNAFYLKDYIIDKEIKEGVPKIFQNSKGELYVPQGTVN